MKKSLAILIFCISNFITAQGVRYGLKGGLNVATFLNTTEKVTPRMGFHLGALAEFQIGDNMYLQPELLFSVVGANRYIERVNYGTQLSYATIPIIVKYYITGGICAELGPYASFIANATQGKGEKKIDVTDNFNAIDYGISGGVNYILPNSLSFGARVNMGLTDVYDTSETINPINNLSLQLSVAYFL